MSPSDNNPILANRPARKLSYNEQYHKSTIAKGTARINEDGSVTTAKVATISLDNGLTYNLPTFNNDTGEDMTAREAVQKFLPDIKGGKIVGYASPELAQIAQDAEHKLMDTDAKESKQSAKQPNPITGR